MLRCGADSGGCEVSVIDGIILICNYFWKSMGGISVRRNAAMQLENAARLLEFEGEIIG